MDNLAGVTVFDAANLPIIDYSRIEAFFSDKTTENVAENEKLLRAVNDFGFLYLKNHGITDEKTNQLFAHAKEFFELPIAEKEKIESSEKVFFHGWFSSERISKSEAADQREGYDIGDDNNLNRPNQWPENRPEFRTDMNYFFHKCHEIHLVLLGAFAAAHGLSKDHFNPLVNEKDHFFRLLHYPPSTPESIGVRLRASPHTDYGTLTLLFNDSNGGLQVRGKDGQWLNVPPISGCAIINGKLPSRYALAWFGNPNRNAWIEPLSSCITEETPKCFEGVWAGKHIADRIAKSHKDGKAPEVWEDSMYRKED
ncbi:thymine dioxygenase [Grosmannia clavigera kw1407]|uniref:Thymine dioxygenase n=1 Tax=Grosmannia clavigera (strain kw1407 / UAMH 11150) TaxID=655863 RepID=F0X7Q4_GROCL|nr:thymine dioxygenase [Grosmannia clavigera kw1407]EFX06610.1 thymine dioxygenase [Grosmannia clavigera kw1407]